VHAVYCVQAVHTLTQTQTLTQP